MTQADRKPKRKPKFRVGQVVRVIHNRDTFIKIRSVRSHLHFKGPTVYSNQRGIYGQVWWKGKDLRPLTKREIGPR
jgi:hypothetical protein